MGNISSKSAKEDLEIRKFSHFPKSDVKDLLAYFKAHYPNGYMTQKDFAWCFKQLFPFGDPSAFSRMLFRTINIGGSEVIDFNELLIAFSILMKGSPFEKLRWIFRLYDEDKDGIITKEEMVTGMKGILSMLGMMYKTKKSPEEIVEEILAKLENKSGFLTFNDFERLGESGCLEFIGFV